MHPTPEPDQPSTESEQAPADCLERARSSVLNVLVAVGLSIAVSGWLLRTRAETPPAQPARARSDALYGSLIALAVASYAARRMLTARASSALPARRDHLFYWSHVGPALIAAMAVPLGLAYGWLVSPRLDAIIPFWAVPFALGFLSLPRQAELLDLGRSSANDGAS
jgi:hypothetical protein